MAQKEFAILLGVTESMVATLTDNDDPIRPELRRELVRVRDEYRWHAESCRERVKRGLPVNLAFPIRWNPYNKVVQDHRNGTIYKECTNVERESRGLVVPWTPLIGEAEVFQPPVK